MLRILSLRRSWRRLRRIICYTVIIAIIFTALKTKTSVAPNDAVTATEERINIVLLCSFEENKSEFFVSLTYFLESLFYHTTGVNIVLHILSYRRNFAPFDYGIQNMKKIALTKNIEVTHEFVELDSLYERLGNQLDFLRSKYTNASIKGNRFLQNEYYIKALYPEVFPTLNKIIALDIDLEFRSSVDDLYREFSKMRPKQMIGMSYDQAPHYRDAFKEYRKKHPGTNIGGASPGYQGFNDGVFIMDLEKVRKMKNYSYYLTPKGTDYLLTKYEFDPLIGVQDFYTLLGAELPEIFYVLDCSFNRQLSLLYTQDPEFNSYHDCESSVKIYHGNGGTSFPVE